MYVVNVNGGQKICIVNVEISLFVCLKVHLHVEITLLCYQSSLRMCLCVYVCFLKVFPLLKLVKCLG